MNTGAISMRYAKALFAYTEHTESSAEVFIEMEALTRSFALEPRLRHYLMNPMLKARDKNKIIKSAISEHVSRQSWRFIRLVVRNHREELIQTMALNYIDLYHKARNINIAYIETAVPLSIETEERLKARMSAYTHGTIELNQQVNSDLIGGFIFQMNFYRMDASVATQLAEMKKQFKNNLSSKL